MKSFLSGLSADGKRLLYSNGDPLTSDDHNVLMARLGAACIQAYKNRGGDRIDTGLVLLRLLNESDFEIREKR